MLIRLGDSAMRSFRVGKVFQETDQHKSSLDFSGDGQQLLVCDSDAITLYSCLRPRQLCQERLPLYQPALACFASQSNQILHSATRLDFALRCLDLNTGAHVRLFHGHTRGASALLFMPHSDHQFMSADLDEQLYLWDVRLSTYVRRLFSYPRPLLAYDPAGLVFAVSSGTQRIDLHDVRMLSDLPCLRFDYQPNERANWTQLQFSPDGRSLLVSTDHSWCFCVDAFDGHFRQSFTGYENEKRLPLQACYSPDSQFVMSGADEGRIHVWRAESGQPVALLRGNNTGGAVRCLRFNPRHMMFVSSDLLTLFWQPDPNSDFDWVVPRSAEQQPLAWPLTIDLTGGPELEEGEIEDDEQLSDDNDVIFVAEKSSSLKSRPAPEPQFQSPAMAVDEEDYKEENDGLEEGELAEDDEEEKEDSTTILS